MKANPNRAMQRYHHGLLSLIDKALVDLGPALVSVI